MQGKGIRILWQLSAVFVLVLIALAYMVSALLRPEASVAEDTPTPSSSSILPSETLVQ